MPEKKNLSGQSSRHAIYNHLHGNEPGVLTSHQVWLQWGPGSLASRPSLQVYGLLGLQSQKGG